MKVDESPDIRVGDGELETVNVPDLMFLVPTWMRPFAARHGWSLIRGAALGFGMTAGIQAAWAVLGSLFAG